MRQIVDIDATFWARFTCEKCKTVNWFYNGCQPHDLTDFDPQAIRCRKCKEIYLIDEKEDLEAAHGEDFLDGIYIVDGEKRPK